MVPLPSGIINSVDRFISQGWTLKIKNIHITTGHPYLFSYYSPEAIAQDLAEPFPKGVGVPSYLWCHIPALPRCLLPQTTFPLKNHPVKPLIIL